MRGPGAPPYPTVLGCGAVAPAPARTRGGDVGCACLAFQRGKKIDQDVRCTWLMIVVHLSTERHPFLEGD